MVTHGRLVEKFGDSPAIKMALRTGKASVCLNRIDDEWVLTWTTGGNETVKISDVEQLKIEPLWEETLTFAGRGPHGRKSYKSIGGTTLDPGACPCCYDGLSFRCFSEIEISLGVNADFYLDWEHVFSGTQYTYK